MVNLDLGRAVSSDMTNKVDDYVIPQLHTDGINEQEETKWFIQDWNKYWGAFNTIPELKSAILMKATWNVGKGFIADPETEVILSHIRGWGKDTFEEILFNMIVTASVGGDAFAEIVREDDLLINLKVLDPSSICIVVNRQGMIERYEQHSKINGKAPKVFQPEDIFHLCNNRLADQIHGISDIKALEDVAKGDQELFYDLKKIMHHQAKPFILWKLKTDDNQKIQEFVGKIDAARNLGEDMFIPDDEETVSYEIVQLNLSQVILEYQNNLKNKFYRSLGLPLIIFGNAGTTESGGKIEYLAHEQVFESAQKKIERQIFEQLGLQIDLISPVTLLENLKSDQAKDGRQGLEFQRNDATAGQGR